MKNNVKALEDIKKAIYKKIAQLDDVSPVYLNEAGQAAREAYAAAAWYTEFYDDVKELSEDECFQKLVSIPNKHPEYYNTIRLINRAIENAVK